MTAPAIANEAPGVRFKWLKGQDYDARFGGWPKVPDLGTRVLPNVGIGGHSRRSRVVLAPEFRESGGRRARSTGMMAGSGGSAVAGGLVRHIPVLARAALDQLQPPDGGGST